MSESNSKLEQTLAGLDLDEAADNAINNAISSTLNKIKGNLSELDIEVESEINEVAIEPAVPRYDKVELADTAIDIYRNNINPKKEAGKKPPSQPSTIASRANINALTRALTGMRTSGNDGKPSPTGPNGVGNLGKLSPTGANDVGNVSNNFDSYYSLTTDMTLEEYESYVQNIFEGEDCGCDHEKKKEKTKKEIDARGGPPGYKDPSMKKEDMVVDLEQKLVTLGSTSWVDVDVLLRETAQEYGVQPKQLSYEFKMRHGMYPDKWIVENIEVEMCGFMPLEEAVRLNRIGAVYEVTFMYRGGTNRLKFFWPIDGKPTKEQMQYEVEKFWPRARLITFYRTIDNQDMGNMMICAPPMTENYQMLQAEDWFELSEGDSSVFEMICEEEGEPISPIMNQEDGT